MKNKTIPKRMMSILLVFVVVLLCGAGDAIANAVTTLDFRNAKKAGLVIQKEVYRTQAATTPLRSGDNADQAFYAENKLSDDDFRFYLWVGQDSDSMTRKSNMPYKRMNDYGEFLHYVNFPLDAENNVDLIVRPIIDSNGDLNYEVYYYDTDGRKTYSDELTAKVASASVSTNSNYATGYAEKEIAARFQADFETADKPVNSFTTGSNGEFYLSDGSDGDQIYILDKEFYDKDSGQNKYACYYVTEDIALLNLLNEGKKSGEYKTEDTALTQATSPLSYTGGDANAYTVHNTFDRPTDEFVIKKSVNYFNTLTNPFSNDTFVFEVLVNEEAPNGLAYTITQGNTVIQAETPLNASPGSTEPARFELKAGQQVNIVGMTKNTYIEVREIIIENGALVNPYYSALERISDADSNNKQYYKYITEPETAVSESDIRKSYIRWTGYFDKSQDNTSKTNFVNIPNTMLISKQLNNKPSNSDEFEFEFEILKNGQQLGENEQLQYYLRDPNGEFYGNGDQPFKTSRGRMRIRDGQTAMFIKLNPDVTYQINETAAYLDESEVTVHFTMSEATDTLTTRGRTVTTEYTFNGANENYLFQNAYAPKSGLVVTKKVTDDYNRVDPDAVYTFAVMQKVGDTDVFKPVVAALPDPLPDEKTADDYIVVPNAKIKIGDTQVALGEIFRLKDGESAIVTNLNVGQIYSVWENDPNVKAKSQVPAQEDYDRPHLFTTQVRVDMDNPTEFYTDNSEKYDEEQTPAKSATISLQAGDSRNVLFTNTTREIKYYFDVEKIIFLDQTAHGTNSLTDDHAEHRFVFRIERFKEGETQFTADKVLETFYVNMCCTNSMTFTNDNDIDLNSSDYVYKFLHHEADGTHTVFIEPDGSNGVRIQKDYDNSDNLGSTSYTYPCSIYQGSKTVMVTKKGIYRVTEVSEWSDTDYDFWSGSNRYKGYGDGRNSETVSNGFRDSKSGNALPVGSGNSVMIDVSALKADHFKSQSWNYNSTTYYRPTASFTNSESEFAYNSSQAWAENQLKKE